MRGREDFSRWAGPGGRRSRPKTKRPPVETEGRLTIACHMKRDNDLVVREHKIKRLIQNPKSLRLSNS